MQFYNLPDGIDPMQYRESKLFNIPSKNLYMKLTMEKNITGAMHSEEYLKTLTDIDKYYSKCVQYDIFIECLKSNKYSKHYKK